MILENVSASELQSIRIIDCNLAIWLIESKYLKMTKAIQIIEFQICQKLIWSIRLIDFEKTVELNNFLYSVNFHDLNFWIIWTEL